jgi:hypothetical protein
VPQFFEQKTEKEDKSPGSEPGETTPAYLFNGADVISAECEVGDTVPADVCAAVLELSVDGTTFYTGGHKSFGYLQPGKTYRVAWNLADFETTSAPAQLCGLEGGWKQVRIRFTGGPVESITAHSALGAVSPPADQKKTAGEHKHAPAGHR